MKQSSGRGPASWGPRDACDRCCGRGTTPRLCHLVTFAIPSFMVCSEWHSLIQGLVEEEGASGHFFLGVPSLSGGNLAWRPSSPGPQRGRPGPTEGELLCSVSPKCCFVHPEIHLSLTYLETYLGGICKKQ